MPRGLAQSSATTTDLYGTLSIDDVQANYDRFVGETGDQRDAVGDAPPWASFG